MSRIEEEYELKARREKLMSQYQYLQAHRDNISSGNFDKSIAAVTGQMSGRSVTQTQRASCKESQIFQTHFNSPVEDQVRSHFVNSVKKTETHLSRLPNRI